MAEIYIEKCREDAKLPAYAHDGDAGMDLYAAEDVIIEPGKSGLPSRLYRKENGDRCRCRRSSCF